MNCHEEAGEASKEMNSTCGRILHLYFYVKINTIQRARKNTSIYIESFKRQRIFIGVRKIYVRVWCEIQEEAVGN